MLVNLYFIEGISRTDTPYYATKGSQATLAKQEAYFTSKLVKSIQQSYYPPHYENVIKFDAEDLDINTQVNYLALEYENKTYYYFIDDIEYISESIIALHVTMDVIQTYMFNIRVQNGIIERKFINRWNNDNTINRSYIRENISSGHFVIDSYIRIDNPVNYTIVGLWREPVNDYFYSDECDVDPASGRGIVLVKGDEWNPYGGYYGDPVDGVTGISSPYTITFFPFVENEVNVAKPGGTFSTSYFAISNFMYSAGKEPRCMDLFIIPFVPVTSYTINNNALVGKLSPNEEYALTYINRASNKDYGGRVDNEAWYNPIVCARVLLSDHHVKSSVIPVKLYTEEKSFSFSKNTDIGIPFSSSFMPMMLDTNYLLPEFGSNTVTCTFPLEQLNVTSFYLHYWADLLSGSRRYLINTEENNIVDKYGNGVVDTAKLQVDMSNDPWNNYNATNRYRWLEAGLNTGITAVKAVITKGVSLGVAAAEKKAILNSRSSFTPKRRQLSKTAQRKLTSLSRGQAEDTAGLATGLLGSSEGLIGQAIQDYNVKNAPETMKATGTLGDILSTLARIFYRVHKVKDYEQVARYYNRNGYLLNEYITNISNIFEYVQNRYYFNVIKLVEADIHLHDVIEDETTVDLIAERFEQGLRLWNVDNNIRYPYVTKSAYTNSEGTATIARVEENVDRVTFTIHANTFTPSISSLINTVVNSIFIARNVSPITVIRDNITVNNGWYTGWIEVPHTAIDATAWLNGEYRITSSFSGYDTTQPIRDIVIGDFTYDNVELDYIS